MSAVLICVAGDLPHVRAGESAASESDHYRIITLPTPEGVAFEVSGLAALPDGRLAIALRRGDVWILHNPLSEAAEAVVAESPVTGPPTDGPLIYSRYASGLHEPLGLAYHDGALLATQRPEITRLVDADDDGRADTFETFASGWGVSGNYHEYAYGPAVDGEGDLWVPLNATLGKGTHPRDSAWRGWILRVEPDGSWSPVAGGLRSPCGVGRGPGGRILFTDQQGNWMPTCGLFEVLPGRFYGHAGALKHCTRDRSPYPAPDTLPAGELFPVALERYERLTLPAVWFPYRKMGQGTTDILLAPRAGAGLQKLFAGQLLAGDFTQSRLSRVFLEEVGGELQGACIPLRRGFQSAVLRLAWGEDGSVFVGQTRRGWNSLGTRSWGLQRLVWTGATPFEVLAVRALPDGFELELTREVDTATARNIASFRATSYTYRYHAEYGSPELDRRELSVRSASPSKDGRRVRLRIAPLRPGYVHEIHADGLRDREGRPLLHAEAYYTLRQLPAPPRSAED